MKDIKWPLIVFMSTMVIFIGASAYASDSHNDCDEAGQIRLDNGECVNCPEHPRCPGNPRGPADPRGPK